MPFKRLPVWDLNNMRRSPNRLILCMPDPQTPDRRRRGREWNGTSITLYENKHPFPPLKKDQLTLCTDLLAYMRKITDPLHSPGRAASFEELKMIKRHHSSFPRFFEVLYHSRRRSYGAEGHSKALGRQRTVRTAAMGYAGKDVAYHQAPIKRRVWWSFVVFLADRLGAIYSTADLANHSVHIYRSFCSPNFAWLGAHAVKKLPPTHHIDDWPNLIASRPLLDKSIALLMKKNKNEPMQK